MAAPFCHADSPLRPWSASGAWPQAAALGYAYTAWSAQPEVLFFNPAGLSQLDGQALRYSHRPWAVDPDADSFAYGGGGSTWGFGLGLESQRTGPAYSDTRGLAAVGLNLGQVSLGLGLRDDEQRWSPHTSAQAIGADAGLLWRPALRGWPLQWGASALQIPLSNSEGAYVPAPQFSFGAALSLESARLSLDAKTAGGRGGLQGGAEVPLGGFLLARLGLSSLGYQGAAVGISGGLGLRYGSDVSVDYAASPAGDQILHSFSVGLRFNEGWAGFQDAAGQQRLSLERTRQRREAELELEAARARQNAKAGEEAGAFPLDAKVLGRTVTLKWEAPAGPAAGPLSYEVYLGMLPNARFRKLSAEPSPEQAWSGAMSLKGVTYYFQVRSQQPGGAPGPVSKVKAVEIP